jgi:Ca2+-transporting ATPase
MIIGVLVQTVAITFSVLTAYWVGYNFYAKGGTEEFRILTARTLAFVTLVASELLRAYTSRSERYPIWKLGFFSNKWMQYAVGFSFFLLLLVVYIPIPQIEEIFSTTPITFQEWLLLIPLMLVPAVVAEIQKLIMTRKAQ